MLKSWLISFLVVGLLAAAYYLNLFKWLAGSGALVTALVLVAVALVAARIILGSPLKDKSNQNKDEEN